MADAKFSVARGTLLPETPDNNTLYFINNDKIYIGSKLYYSGAFVSASTSGNLVTLTKANGTTTVIDFTNMLDTLKSSLIGAVGDPTTADTIWAAKNIANAKISNITAGNSGISIAGTAVAKTVSVVVDPSTNNALKLNAGGLFVPSADANYITSIEDTNSIDLNVSPISGGALSANLKLDVDTKNIIKSSASGTFASVFLGYNGASGAATLYSGKDTNGTVLATINLPLEQTLDSAKWFLSQATFDADTEFKTGLTGIVIPAGGAIVMKMIIKSTTPTYSGIVIPTEQLIPSNVITESEIKNGLEVVTGNVNVKIDSASTAGVISVSAAGIKINTSAYLTSALAATTYATITTVNALTGRVATLETGKVDKTTTINNKALSGNVVLDGADIAITGYTKPTTTSALAATDTVNVALGKLEKGLTDATSGSITSLLPGNGIAIDASVSSTPKISVNVNQALSDVTLSASSAGLSAALKLNVTQGNVVLTTSSSGLSANMNWIEL